MKKLILFLIILISSFSTKAQLLSGCTVSISNTPNCTIPTGWGIASIQGFEPSGLSAGQTFFSNSSRECTFAHTGTCALVRFNNSGDQPTGLIITGLNTRETVASWWEYLEPQTKLNLQMITIRRALFGSGGSTITDILWNWEDGANVNGTVCYQNCTSAQSSIYAEGRNGLPNFSKYDGTYPLIFGSWVHYEVDLKTNDPGVSNGKLVVYRNDSLIQSFLNVNFNGSQDMALAQLEVGGFNEALVYYNDAAHTICTPPQQLGPFTINNTHWSACQCAAQCPPSGTIPTFNRYIDDIIVIKPGPTSGEVLLSPTSANFSQGVSSSSTGTNFVLTNTTSSAITPNISLTGANANQFSEVDTCGSSLASNSTCSITVTFSPTGIATDSATLNGGGLSSTLSGTVPNASFSPTSLSYGNVNVNNTATLITTLTNNGTGTLTVNTSSTSSPYSQSHACSNIAPNSTCIFNVTFAPTSAATFNNNLVVTFGNGVANSTIPLSGTGITPTPPIGTVTNPFWGLLVNCSCNSQFLLPTGQNKCTCTLSF